MSNSGGATGHSAVTGETDG